MPRGTTAVTLAFLVASATGAPAFSATNALALQANNVSALRTTSAVRAQSFWSKVGHWFEKAAETIGHDVSDVVSDVEKWAEKEACTICEDAVKAAGYIMTALLEDTDGEGEAEAAIVTVFKVAVAQAKADAKALVESEFCSELVDPVAKAIGLMDSGINVDKLESCGTQICTTSINVILSSFGQALISKILSAIFAASCSCPAPFAACGELSQPGSKLATGPALEKQLELAASNEQRAQKDTVKTVLLLLNSTSNNSHITPLSSACQIDEWDPPKGKEYENARSGYETVPVHGCLSDMDCQGHRTCQSNDTSLGPWWCVGEAGPGCCPYHRADTSPECPTLNMLNSLPGSSANSNFLTYGNLRTRLFFPFGDQIFDKTTRPYSAQAQEALGMNGEDFKRSLDDQCLPCYGLYNDGDAKPSTSCTSTSNLGVRNEVPYTDEQGAVVPTGYSFPWPDAECICAVQQTFTDEMSGFHPSQGAMYGVPMPPASSTDMYSYVCQAQNPPEHGWAENPCSSCRPQPIMSHAHTPHSHVPHRHTPHSHSPNPGATCASSAPDVCPDGYTKYAIGDVGVCKKPPTCPSGTDQHLGRCYSICPDGYRPTVFTCTRLFPPSITVRSSFTPSRPTETGLQCAPGTTLAGVSALGIQLGLCYDSSCYKDTLAGDATSIANSVEVLFGSGVDDLDALKSFGACLEPKTNLWSGLKGDMAKIFSTPTGLVDVSEGALTNYLVPLYKQALNDSAVFTTLLETSFEGMQSIIKQTPGFMSNPTALLNGAADMSSLVVNFSAVIVNAALEVNSGTLEKLSKIPGLEALGCVDTYIAQPLMKTVEAGVIEQLVVEVLVMFVNILTRLGQSHLIIAVMTGLTDSFREVADALVATSDWMDKIDKYVEWGAAKGCNAVIGELTDMLRADTAFKPPDLDCSPDAATQPKLAEMTPPMFEATITGLLQLGMTKLHELVYAPMSAQLMALITTASEDIEKGLSALCGLIPEVGAAACNAAMGAIDTALMTTLPPLVQDLLQSLYTQAEQFVTNTVPEWTAQAVTWFKQTKLGKQGASLSLTIEGEINELAAPVARVMLPLAQDTLAFTLPKLETELATCMDQYSTLYKGLQRAWCHTPSAHASAVVV